MVSTELGKTGWSCAVFQSPEIRIDLREKSIPHLKDALQQKGWIKNFRTVEEDMPNDEGGIDYLLVGYAEKE